MPPTQGPPAIAGGGAELLVALRLRTAGFVHGFSTRAGELDFRQGRTGVPTYSDAETRLLAALGLGSRPLRTCRQVHGSCVVEATEGIAAEACEADALVSGPGGPAVGIRTADCLPLLLADRRTGAVAAVHAGWRGCVAGVVVHAVEQLRIRWGSRPQDILGAIGPHARADCYEVSEEVAAALSEAAGPRPPETVVVRRFVGQRPHVSLRAVVLAQLERLGIGRGHIEDVGGCTISDATRFFSYRREGDAAGRHLAVIAPVP